MYTHIDCYIYIYIYIYVIISSNIAVLLRCRLQNPGTPRKTTEQNEET